MRVVMEAAPVSAPAASSQQQRSGCCSWWRGRQRSDASGAEEPLLLAHEYDDEEAGESGSSRRSGSSSSAPAAAASSLTPCWGKQLNGDAAGRSVLLNLPALGRRRWHPFSVVSCCDEQHAASVSAGSTTLTFLIRDTGNGGWTTRLSRLARDRARRPPATTAAAAGGGGEEAALPVRVLGPYGGVPRSFLEGRQCVVLLAGGIGVTPVARFIPRGDECISFVSSGCPLF